MKKQQNDANSISPVGDTSAAITADVSHITEQTIELQTIPAMEQLTLETTNDLSAGNSAPHERVHTNEILLPQQQENEMTGSVHASNIWFCVQILTFRFFRFSHTASMIKKGYVTEDEAKAALAERRRVAREEAERQAELERQRKEAEELAEEQRIADEEENQRRLEEETLRLVEEQKKAEELRLLQAIEVSSPGWGVLNPSVDRFLFF